MSKIMKEVKKHIQNEYLRNAFILRNWKDSSIANIPKLSEIVDLGRRGEYKNDAKIEKIAYMLSELAGKRPAGNWEKLVRIQSRALTYLRGRYNEE